MCPVGYTTAGGALRGCWGGAGVLRMLLGVLLGGNDDEYM